MKENKVTIINIGTDQKNLVGVQINKPYDDITLEDIKNIVERVYGKGVHIEGWAFIEEVNQEELLNHISKKVYKVIFNQLPDMKDRAIVLAMALKVMFNVHS